MISYIKGTLVHRGENHIILETGGIGYQIFVSAGLLSKMPALGTELKIFTYMSVKEDGITLFGFSSKEEQEIFLKLLTVGGVGPKGALGFLSQLTPQEIIIAILSADEKTLSKAPGVGRKTAQRVILELKDKCSAEDAIAIFPNVEAAASSFGGEKLEAIEAMAALGYSRSEAAKAVGQAAAEGMTTEEILKAALKKMITF
ncbi:MAG: Holliday junction branch migration protein RuvA [Clostridia bacterium]|nr:Holliday junction branch migration protein RuvA [Anaerotignum sp.]NCC16656.1 Holliday junction branch migration protein RuvA [Clostridia bacterium]